MSDTFECVQCGAKYTRERRRVGRAVVCTCGHKFLVPPAEESRPPSHPSRQARQPRSQMDVAAGSDSSGEVLPLAELIETPAQPAERWAEPMETAEPLAMAEIVDAEPLEPAYPADELFDPGEAYAEPVESTARAPVARRPATAGYTPNRRSKHVPEERTNGGNRGVAYIVLYAFIALSVLLLVAGLVQYQRLRRLTPGAEKGSSSTAPQSALDGPSSAPSTQQPDDGLPIVIRRVTKRAASDDFTLEYDVPQGLSGSSQYVWVISAGQARIEFPIPPPAQGNGQISGKPGQPAGLAPPFTSFIEAQSGSQRTRVSNEVDVAIGG